MSTTQTVSVTTYFLEMLDRADLRPKRAADPDFRVQQVIHPCPEFNRFFYSAVGWQWFWIDKLPWTFEQWRAHVDRPNLTTWVGYHAGTPCGYFELERQPDDHVEIVYFGLLPQFTGRGLGGALLTEAIERGWDWSAKRVWVHTCTLDHPGALANYLARGFRQFKQEVSTKIIPLVAQRW